MSSLLRRVFGIAAGRCRVGQGGDRVPVLAGVERKRLLRQLPALPACVERMLEDVPAGPRLVDSLDQIHLGSQFAVTTPSGRQCSRRYRTAASRAALTVCHTRRTSASGARPANPIHV